MARVIYFPVGQRGNLTPAMMMNLSSDTTTVQVLLNQAPASEGGAAPALAVDGKCGPLTIAAIRKFQLKRFGWGGADGRVDPDGPTLVALNTFDKVPVEPPAPPAPPPALPKSNDFFLIHMSPRRVSTGDSKDMFFLISDMSNNLLAVYWMDRINAGAPDVETPAGNNWSGAGGRFHTKLPRAIDGFKVPVVWFSRQDESGVVTSNLVLDLGGDGVAIPFGHHLIGVGGQVGPGTGGGGVGTSASGNFRLVELR